MGQSQGADILLVMPLALEMGYARIAVGASYGRIDVMKHSRLFGRVGDPAAPFFLFLDPALHHVDGAKDPVSVFHGVEETVVIVHIAFDQLHTRVDQGFGPVAQRITGKSRDLKTSG